jgi:TPP-dependent pyruvate/acetoin dehydrogenase alpha subunit
MGPQIRIRAAGTSEGVMARADTWSGFILGKPTVMSPESILKLYRTMQIIRQTEEELARCHQRGLVHGACHTYVG